MISPESTSQSLILEQVLKSIQTALDQSNYSKVIDLCEEAIQVDASEKQLFWYLGLAMMLQGKEEEAQMTWMLAAAEGEPEEVEIWTQDLLDILLTEAQKKFEQERFEMAWAIRQYARELSPENWGNTLELLRTSLKLGHTFSDALTDLEICEFLSEHPISRNENSLLLESLELGLKKSPFDQPVACFSEKYLSLVEEPGEIVTKLLAAGFAYMDNLDYRSALNIGEVLLKFRPEDIEIIGHVATWNSSIHAFDKEIELAEQRLLLSERWVDKIFSSFMLLRALMGAGGYWDRACQVCADHEALIKKLETNPLEPDTKLYELLRLATSTFFFPYFKDASRENRNVHNLVAKIFSNTMRASQQAQIETYDFQSRLKTPKQKLRIGYISHCFRQHSVGYLARWLIGAHNRDEFEVYGYVIYQRDYDLLQQWYKHQFDHVCEIGSDCPEEGKDIAQRIYDDEIDILIDLDSITLDLTCEVMAYRPAPIQVTWLGWDASGIPEIDYYLADPYVLPESAQDYYCEKIWRLPQTYLAISGFEVNVPDISRASLGIPEDAVVYLTAQRGFKRHPDTVRLQMQILREVPNSYLLIKGPAEQTAIQQYFAQLAEECNVPESQLRFLPQTLQAETHRANLRIADVVLDTFPYNGATTTMETLWMEVPLVTLVGQQFAARNSYTMMVNAGIEEGIAWTPEEYVQWGVRLGTDEQLRQKVAWKLRESKKRSPLWNTAAFTREVEKAYQSMWQSYAKQIQVST